MARLLHPTDPHLNLFLLLTAMLSALTGVGRPVATPVSVEASRVLSVAQAIVPAARRAAAARPDGYVAPQPLRLDLALTADVVRPVTPERRRE